MKTLLAIASLLASAPAFANCVSTLPLEGSVLVPTCSTKTEGCVTGAELVAEYASIPDDDPTTLTVAIQTSPWRIYDGAMRILTPAEFAAMIRPHIKPEMTRVELQASWSDVAPAPGDRSLTQRLSAELDGFPVRGLDGFHWIKPDGRHRTTRQAFSLWEGGSYHAKRGEEVMPALTVGWFTTFQDRFVAEKNAEALLAAGVGWDAFSLCPDRSLEAFELAADAGSAIGAYNAAMIRRERKAEGDEAKAALLLQRAVALGDAKAASLLKALQAAPASSP